MAGAFETYLRTGLVRRAPPYELKYNPWHDPDDGRFTFRNSGQYFGQGNAGFATRPRRDDPRVVKVRGAKREAAVQTTDSKIFAPEHPRNHTVYRVRKGDTLTSIAAQRSGLRASDLSRLNALKQPDKLLIGQSLKLPIQAYLDSGKKARAKVMALAHYIETHDGRLPPNPANPPTIQQQIDSEWRTERRNGHIYRIDLLNRTRFIFVDLSTTAVEGRSRAMQRAAGGADRLATDEGGHYVAPGLGGPPIWFNHFAQDRNFNRGEYRMMEKEWFAQRAAGKGGKAKIYPRFNGFTQRPYKLYIEYPIDGGVRKRHLSNRRGGK